MSNRRWGAAAIAVALIVVWTACGKTDTDVQNPPPPPSTLVSIAFQPAPVASVNLIATAQFTAVVSNDPSNEGVDWALLCPAGGSCGTLSPLHTASGVAATYIPPRTITGNQQMVTIEAFATADQTKNLVASLAVTGFAGSLKGTYVFQTKGQDVNGVFQLAGVVALDGNGNVTKGEQTHSDALLSVTDSITGGAYTIGPDGRGTLTLNTADQNIGQLGIENLSLVFLSSSQALIATLDNPNLQGSNETSSGTLELQIGKPAPKGGYAFVANGVDLSFGPLGMGGVINVDSPKTISGAGSVADEDDIGTVTPSAPLSGTVTNPDSFGSVQFNLTTGFARSLQLIGYIVDATHIKLIESDINGLGAGFASTGGVAIAQGSSTGKFTSNSSFAGGYVFYIVGQSPSEYPVSLTSVGQFTADTNGNLKNGYDDEILGGPSIIPISDTFTGTYVLDAIGTGRVDSTVTFTVNGPGPELIFYLAGNGNPPLVLDADDNGSSLGFASVGAGLVYPKGTGQFAFSGKYGLSFTQGSSTTENDATGQTTVNGASNILSGIIDTNLSLSANPDQPLTGTFVPPANVDRFSGTLTNTFFISNAQTMGVEFYPVDSNQVLFVETDSAFSGETTLGSFVARTPICPTCQ